MERHEVGGTHYEQMATQPIELISRLRCDFTQGCIIKYICRYKNKNGAEDLKKSIDYAELAVQHGESEYRPDDIINVYENSKCIEEFFVDNKLTALQMAVINSVLLHNYRVIIPILECILAIEYPKDRELK